MQQPPHSTLYLEAERHADGKKSAFQKTTLRSSLTALHAAQPQSIYLRDGELFSCVNSLQVMPPDLRF